MKSKKLLSAAVAAITMLVGGLGVALWPSPADALGTIRKFSGALWTGDSPYGLYVRVHNPHPTGTLKARVLVRDADGNLTYSREQSVGPNRVVTETPPWCRPTCTVEVIMANAILQPSITYYSTVSQHWQQVHAGDFSR